MKLDRAKRIILGTWSELWLDGEQVGEAYGFQLKVGANREKVYLCGDIWEDSKLTSVAGTGTMRTYKVNSRMSILVADKLANGIDPEFTLVEKQHDPDADGQERIAVKQVRFDDATLADWEAGQLGKVECPFIYKGYDRLDTIQPR